MSRYNNTSWSTIGLIFCVALSMLLFVGIESAREIHQEYTLPIYISKSATISGYSSYTVKCELANLTNEDVYVDALTISLSGNEGNTRYHTTEKLNAYGFIVPAKSTYELVFEDIVYVKPGNITANGELTSASISKCVLNGETVELKKRDGEYFVSQGGNSTGYIYAIVIGSLGIMGTTGIIIYNVKEAFF